MEENTDDAAKLQEMMDDIERDKYRFTSTQEEKLTRLSCAAVAITSDDSERDSESVCRHFSSVSMQSRRDSNASFYAP